MIRFTTVSYGFIDLDYVGDIYCINASGRKLAKCRGDQMEGMDAKRKIQGDPHNVDHWELLIEVPKNMKRTVIRMIIAAYMAMETVEYYSRQIEPG